MTALINRRDRAVIYLGIKMFEVEIAPAVAPSIKFRAIVEDVWLSDRDSEVLALIAIFTTDKGYAPTTRQIAVQCCNRSNSEACTSIHSLLNKQLISRFEIGKDRVGVTRSLQVLTPLKLEFVNG